MSDTCRTCSPVRRHICSQELRELSQGCRLCGQHGLLTSLFCMKAAYFLSEALLGARSASESLGLQSSVAVAVGCAHGLLIWRWACVIVLAVLKVHPAVLSTLGQRQLLLHFRLSVYFWAFYPTLGSVVSHRLTQMAELVYASQW